MQRFVKWRVRQHVVVLLVATHFPMRLFALSVGLLALLLGGCTSDAPSPAPDAPSPATTPALFPVPVDDAWGFIDRAGHLTIAPRFDRAWRFTNGRALIRQGNRFGYIDTTGSVVIPPRFADAWHFSEGLAPVQQDSLWGFINPSGEVVVNPQFDLAPRVLEDHPANGPFYRTRVNGQYGFRNEDGELIIAPQFEHAWHFAEGRARVRKDSLWGFIDPTGTVVIAPRFAQAWDFRDGLARVTLPDGTIGYVNRTGTLVWPDP